MLPNISICLIPNHLALLFPFHTFIASILMFTEFFNPHFDIHFMELNIQIRI